MKQNRQYNLAFVLKDDVYGIDSLVYVEYLNNQLAIKTSQKVEDLKYFVAAYITGVCAPKIGCDLKDVELLFFDGSKDATKAYQRFKAMPKQGNLMFRSIADLVGEFREYEHPCKVLYKDHSATSSEFVPDFAKMSADAFTKWTQYFMGDKDDVSGKQ
jgi:hypothetical protein